MSPSSSPLARRFPKQFAIRFTGDLRDGERRWGGKRGGVPVCF